MEQTFVLTIVLQPSGVRHELNFSGRTTIEDVKQKVYYVTEIPARHQEWTGWPHGCENQTTLAVRFLQLFKKYVSMYIHKHFSLFN